MTLHLVFLVLGATATAFVAVLATLALSIHLYSRRRVVQDADVAIVLGARVWGREPSPVFRERINQGIDLYNRGLVPKILFTGGLGTGERLSEAEAARLYALEKGVPDGDILLETESRTTFENMVYSKRVMEEHGLGTALIVSDPIHMRRAMLMASRVGIDAEPHPTHTTRFISRSKKIRFLWKETLSLLMYLWLRY
ncbi:MAG: YdcF family protein [Candidatus Sumerlaeia bacterium]|nr:YdcF family protein [Candidatus Sumerlaeia bacterium]